MNTDDRRSGGRRRLEPHRRDLADDQLSSSKVAKKVKSPLWAKLVVVLGALLMVASGGVAATVNVMLGKVDDAVDQESMLGDSVATPTEKGPVLQGPLNLLLIGVDERTVSDDPEGTRADTIIVFHINAAHDKAYFLSVPRDTLADIPAFPKTKFGGRKEKINAAFQHGSDNGGGRTGGFELLANTVSKVTGITFNAGAIVNFAGFQSVVEALGGVNMCIDQKVTSIHRDVKGNELPSGVPAMTYQPGCRHLEPWQALDYVRQRHTSGGDYDRQRHQQQFLKAVAKEAMSQGMTDVGKLNRVMSAAGKTLTFDPGAAHLTDWIFLLKGIGTDGIQMVRTNGGEYASVKCPDKSSCQYLTAKSLKMFAAAKSDTLEDFLAENPTWLAKA
ncbi:LCP family protein [Hamadaea sp.]|uniref:LCP family protein n=1 Tax=Hamadaea sp. TaxID=2024425 RepID=UPI0025BFDA2F|nr:LCP family protein [Hamadaea sp.]